MMNLLNIDLKLNYAMTILNKLQMLKSKKGSHTSLTSSARHSAQILAVDIVHGGQ